MSVHHLILPWASAQTPDCQDQWPALALPQLQRLLSRLKALPALTDSDERLSMPHERALASALDLPGGDGLLPWAAVQARHDLPNAPAQPVGWAFVSLCHWQVHTHQVLMGHLPLAGLTATESDALLESMRDYFAEDGITLYAEQPGRWLAQSDLFASVSSAALDRVCGRNPDVWMPTDAIAAPLRRLQNEMQMLLYTHPVNDVRQAHGLPVVNSFWLHGCGTLAAEVQLPAPAAWPQVVPDLRNAALAGDWSAWAQAWQRIDTTRMAALHQALDQGDPVRLTLCGERNCQCWTSEGVGLWQRVRQRLTRQPLTELLASL